MSKRWLLLLLMTGVLGTVQAQRGHNAITVLAELGLPDEEYNPGVGGYIKFQYGIGRSGQLGLTTGVSKFRAKATLIGSSGRSRSSLRAIPVLLGYRQNIKSFYIEPQAGFGELGGKIDIGGDYSRPSRGAFFWAAGAGFQLNRFDFGARFQHAKTTSYLADAVWGEKRFYHTGIYAGYSIWRKQ